MPHPPSPRDWLPNGHLAWFIHDAVETLDVSRLREDSALREGGCPAGTGERPCPSRVMLRLLIYTYCTGTFSSRRIAANLEISIALRVLAAGHEPSHRTIIRFREENLAEFHRLFLRVVEIAREAKLIKMGAISIGPNKAKANARKHEAVDDFMLREEQRLREELAKLTRAAKKQDDLDDEVSLDPAAVKGRRPKRRDAGIGPGRSR